MSGLQGWLGDRGLLWLRRFRQADHGDQITIWGHPLSGSGQTGNARRFVMESPLGLPHWPASIA
jgi:hypothetical protein